MSKSGSHYFFRNGLRLASLTVAVVALMSCTAMNPPKPYLPSKAGISPGETITVKGSQNIYGVARKYNVPMRDLIVLNNIQPPFLVRQGQKLVLPAGTSVPAGEVSESSSGSPLMPPPSSVASGSVQSESLPPIQSAPLPPIAQSSSSKPTMPTAEALSTPSPVRSIPTTTDSPPPPSALQQVAAVNPTMVKPSEPTSSDSSAKVNFIWPLQGPVVSAYGPKGQGLNNDGVNIGAPKGTPVVAAANGIVVYAGNDMKGFGNLVLIRHTGGYITAYAHLERVLVSKDAVVAQGDMIGSVGKTGDVNTPQVHFEIRYQGKAVDPNDLVKS